MVAPPKAVFDAIVDARTFPEWWKPVYVEVKTDGPPELGKLSYLHPLEPRPGHPRPRALRSPTAREIKDHAAPPLSIPPEIEAVFREIGTCKFTEVNRAGQPLTWPTETHFLQQEGHIVVTSSIACPVKAYNARRHPKVALLFSDPMGSGIVNAPAVLVQVDTAVRESDDDPPWSFEMFKGGESSPFLLLRRKWEAGGEKLRCCFTVTTPISGIGTR